MPQSLMRAQDTVPATFLKEIPRKNWNVHANTPMDLTRAAADTEAHPKYDTMDDWHGGVLGDDVGENDAAQAIVGRNGGIDNDYEPRHQEEKAEKLGVVLVESVTYDYGPWGALPGHGGPIEPFEPYPETP